MKEVTIIVRLTAHRKGPEKKESMQRLAFSLATNKKKDKVVQ